MRWTRQGIVRLAKMGKKIVDNECDSWWPKKAIPIKLIMVYSLLFKLMYNVNSI
jgi:hypothetical protein